jgi:hypothetical protein
MCYALCITHYPLPIPVSARTDSPMAAAQGAALAWVCMGRWIERVGVAL